MDSRMPLMLFVWVSGFSLFYLGLMSFMRGVDGWLEYRASRNWVEVNARVIESGVETVQVQRIGGLQGKQTYWIDVYEPKIVYAYQIDNQFYLGSHLRIGYPDSYNDLSQAQQQASHYPLESIAVVTYNPASPGQSVLIAEITNQSRTWLTQGIILFIAGIFLMISPMLFG